MLQKVVSRTPGNTRDHAISATTYTPNNTRSATTSTIIVATYALSTTTTSSDFYVCNIGDSNSITYKRLTFCSSKQQKTCTSSQKTLNSMNR